jgi:uncharacterized membrane protein YphA (DoxX/SURF4 family)
MQILKDSRLIFVSRLIIGGLFIYASVDKALHPLGFAQVIHNYRLFPPSLINIAAILLPWVEVLAGVLIIIGYKVRGSNLILGGLLVIYIMMLSITAYRGININCGCFSTSATVKSNLIADILRDVVFLIFSLHIMAYYKSSHRHRLAA